MNANSDKDYIDAKMESIDARMDARFAAIDARFAAVDARFAAMEAKFAEFRADVLAQLAKNALDMNKSLIELSNKITDLAKWWAATFIATIALIITGMAMMWNVALPRAQQAALQAPAPAAPVIIQLPPWPAAPAQAAAARASRSRPEISPAQISRLSIKRVVPSLAAASTTSGVPCARSPALGGCRSMRLRIEI